MSYKLKERITEDQKQQILALEKHHINHVRRLLGCSYYSAVELLADLNIDAKKRQKMKSFDIEYLRSVAPKMTVRQLAIKLNMHPATVYSFLQKNKIQYIKPRKEIAPRVVKIDFSNMQRRKYGTVKWKNGLEVRADAFGLEISSKRITIGR